MKEQTSITTVAGLVVALCCLSGGASQAGGIPTVDAGVIAQQLRAYQQLLRDFEVQLQQAGLDRAQLGTLNRQFRQTLREYDDYLRQVRGLQRVIARADWERLFWVLKYQYGISPYAGIAGGSGQGQAGRDAIDAEVNKLYQVPAPPGPVRRQLAAAGLDPAPWASQAERNRARYQAYRDQLELARDGNRELLERYRKVQVTKRHFDLGDKSDLNALQTAVTTNFHIIDELQALNRNRNLQLLHANHQYVQALSAAEAQRRAEAGRLERLAGQSRTTRAFRWRDLQLQGPGR